jgi:hypothetical protein
MKLRYCNSIPDDLFKPVAQDERVVGLCLYMMRLNAPTLRRVEDWLQEIIPCDLDSHRTIALPIRASDKCIGKFHIDPGFGVREIGRGCGGLKIG